MDRWVVDGGRAADGYGKARLAYDSTTAAAAAIE